MRGSPARKPDVDEGVGVSGRWDGKGSAEVRRREAARFVGLGILGRRGPVVSSKGAW